MQASYESDQANGILQANKCHTKLNNENFMALLYLQNNCRRDILLQMRVNLKITVEFVVIFQPGKVYSILH